MNLRWLADIFFPRACAACGRSLARGAICGPCRAGIALYGTLFCAACGGAAPAPHGTPCNPGAPYLLGAAASYDSPAVQALVQALKFRFSRDCAEPLADMLVRYVRSLPTPFPPSPRPYIVVPVPLSRARFRARGFNQSELIARIFAERLGLPIETAPLRRIRHRKPQSETKNRAERLHNIRGCFEADTNFFRGPEHASRKNIILIDDVTTSGATFLEIARTLTAAGAEKIIALAAAKA